MTGRRSRDKGGRGEREIVEILRSYGWQACRRNFTSGAQGGGDVTGLPGVHLEVKYREALSIWKALAQAETEAADTDVPVVAFRRNGTGWYAALPLDDLLALLQLREAA